MNWETWLRAAAKRPSDNETTKRDRTVAEIEAALGAYPPLWDRPYRVYAKGSYANNTNVRLNFDVDIAVEYTGYFFCDLDFDLEGAGESSVGVGPSAEDYEVDDFKADVLAALKRAYGDSAVTPGRIAYRIRERNTTLPADVVPCWEYRRYDRIRNGVPVYWQGTRMFPSDGGSVDNYPEIQLENGRDKTRKTGRRYKRMVRGFKKLQTRMKQEGVIRDELASYLTECLVYNVPNDAFACENYLDDMRGVLRHIFNETLPNGDWGEWHDVHELMYLFRGRPWSRHEVHEVASEAWDYLGFD